MYDYYYYVEETTHRVTVESIANILWRMIPGINLVFVITQLFRFRYLAATCTYPRIIWPTESIVTVQFQSITTIRIHVLFTNFVLQIKKPNGLNSVFSCHTYCMAHRLNGTAYSVFRNNRFHIYLLGLGSCPCSCLVCYTDFQSCH